MEKKLLGLAILLATLTATPEAAERKRKASTDEKEAVEETPDEKRRREDDKVSDANDLIDALFARDFDQAS